MRFLPLLRRRLPLVASATPRRRPLAIAGLVAMVAALAACSVAAADVGSPASNVSSAFGHAGWGSTVRNVALVPGVVIGEALPAPSAPPAQPAIKRVGIQAGHWLTADAPDELASLRTSTGAEAAGYREVDLNLKIANLVADILRGKGIQVDVLPTTIPVKYQADAFVAIHSDADGSAARGFKIARNGRSLIPAQDDALMQSLYSAYGKITGLPTSDAITSAMRYYYAFSAARREHTVADNTPAAIVEMGYLTNSRDRNLMLDSSDVVANGIAQGILDFLNSGSSSAGQQAPGYGQQPASPAPRSPIYGLMNPAKT
jgi:hypothetical protein